MGPGGILGPGPGPGGLGPPELGGPPDIGPGLGPGPAPGPGRPAGGGTGPLEGPPSRSVTGAGRALPGLVEFAAGGGFFSAAFIISSLENI